MSEATHRREILASEKLNALITDLQRSLSPSYNPNNPLTSLYATTRQLIWNNWDDLLTLRTIMRQFRADVEEEIRAPLETAGKAGVERAQDSLESRRLATPASIIDPTPTPLVNTATTTTMAIVDTQIQQTLAAAEMQGNIESVVGDGVNSLGLFSQGPVNRQHNLLLTGVAIIGYEQLLQDYISTQLAQNIFYKQAVAAIDERVTDCCLRVHGQFQPTDLPFILDGTPRFADEVFNPPFHWNCRTVTALVHASERFDGVTQDMLVAAAEELAARGVTGYRVEIHPAYAFSGR